METSGAPETDAPTHPAESRPEQLRTDLADTSAEVAESNGHVPPPSTAEEQAKSVVPPEEPSLASSSLTLPAAPVPEPIPLEQRVRRLEETVKEIRETRFTDRPAPEPAPPLPMQPLSAPPLDFVLPPAAPAHPPARPQDFVMPPAAPPLAPAPSTAPPRETQRSWLFKEMWVEARAIQFMFFDPRYSMPWARKLLPLLLLAAFLTTSYWLPGAAIPGIGLVLEKGVLLLLGFALFKVLGHEARRYRETSPDLPPSLRL